MVTKGLGQAKHQEMAFGLAYLQPMVVVFGEYTLTLGWPKLGTETKVAATTMHGQNDNGLDDFLAIAC